MRKEIPWKYSVFERTKKKTKKNDKKDYYQRSQSVSSIVWVRPQFIELITSFTEPILKLLSLQLRLKPTNYYTTWRRNENFLQSQVQSQGAL